jgi:hypothetical protein
MKSPSVRAGIFCIQGRDRWIKMIVGRNPKSVHINLVIVQKNSGDVDTCKKLWYKHIVLVKAAPLKPPLKAVFCRFSSTWGSFRIQTADSLVNKNLSGGIET